MNIEKIGEVARIVMLREELQRKRKELETLLVEYIQLNRDQQKPVPWRKLARQIGMDHMQPFRIAKRYGLVAGRNPKRTEPAQPRPPASEAEVRYAKTPGIDANGHRGKIAGSRRGND